MQQIKIFYNEANFVPVPKFRPGCKNFDAREQPTIFQGQRVLTARNKKSNAVANDSLMISPASKIGRKKERNKEQIKSLKSKIIYVFF